MSSAPIRTTRTSLHSNVKTSKSFLTTQTTDIPQTATSNPNMNMKSNALLVGAITVALIIILIIVSIMVALLIMRCSIKVKKNHSNSNEVSMVNNEAYATALQLMVDIHQGRNTPQYPNQIMAIDTEQNEAYATSAETKQSAVYITTDRNAAYGGSCEPQDTGTESGVYEYVL